MLVEDYFRNVFPSWISTFSDRDRERDRRHPFAGQWSEQSRNMRTASLSLRGLAEWPECSGSLTRIAEDGKQKRAFEVRAFVWRDAGGGPLFRGFLTALEAAERRFRQGNAGEPTVCRSEKKTGWTLRTLTQRSRLLTVASYSRARRMRVVSRVVDADSVGASALFFHVLRCVCRGPCLKSPWAKWPSGPALGVVVRWLTDGACLQFDPRRTHALDRWLLVNGRRRRHWRESDRTCLSRAPRRTVIRLWSDFRHLAFFLLYSCRLFCLFLVTSRRATDTRASNPSTWMKKLSFRTNPFHCHRWWWW